MASSVPPVTEAADRRLDRYDLVFPPTVVFGWGRRTEVGPLVARSGGRALVVGGRRGFVESPARESIAASLEGAGVTHHIVATVAGEPTVDAVVAALRTVASLHRPGDVIVAVGGGSAIDLAKAVAGLTASVPPHADDASLDQLVVDHLEGVGRGSTLAGPPIPLIALPTTAGTGAEATRNAVIGCPRRRFKKSLRSPWLVPRGVIVDPELTVACDRTTTAAAGLDCITQLVESFICRFSTPVPRALVAAALPGALAALPRVLDDPADAAARATLAHAALVSGIALTNSGLGMAHGVAAALGVECGVAHGVACGLLLPVAVEVNRDAARADLAGLERRCDPFAPADDEAAVGAFGRRIADLVDRCGLPRTLRDVGLAADRIGWLAANSGGASMRGNPLPLDAVALRPILERIF
ncbi:MAG: iron-containing alcohol dehydrogenase [Planctomycetaceae bacterium]